MAALGVCLLAAVALVPRPEACSVSSSPAQMAGSSLKATSLSVQMWTTVGGAVVSLRGPMAEFIYWLCIYYTVGRTIILGQQTLLHALSHLNDRGEGGNGNSHAGR